jgi:CBS domain-containing protein
MVRRRPLPGQRLRHPLRQRAQRLTSRRAVREALVSLAGLLGSRVDNQAGEEVGRLADLVARWADAPGPASSQEVSVESYPPVTGLVVQVGHRQVFVAAEQVAELGRQGVQLSSARLDLRELERREGEVLLARDVLDHQLVDTDGMKVIRAADLYLAHVGGAWRLVGVDVSMHTLARRLGPARWRWVPTPDRVIDWAAIQPFGIDPGQVRLRGSARELRRLRPGELADLLEDLGRPERQQLLASLEPEVAADALEEMDPGELDALLHEIPAEQTAALLARMEPDEAVDALRELDVGEREALLERLPDQVAAHLSRLLAFPEDRAGGIMTSVPIQATEQETVARVCQRLREVAGEQPDLDVVVVVDGQGRLVDVVGMVELLAAEPGRRLAELIGPPWPVTVEPMATLGEVAEALVENRRTSVLVTDEDGRPLGRIGADDVVDALLPERGRLHFPRLLQ